MIKSAGIFAIIAYLFTGIAFAGSPSPEFGVDETSSRFHNRSVKEDIDDFLTNQGFSEGENARPQGGDIFIAVGTGIIEAPRSSPSYMSSRINAFDKAMIAAKSQMVEYLGVSIQNEVLDEYSEGQSPAERKKKKEAVIASQAAPSIFDKALALVNAKLDSLLVEEGVDLNKPVPKETLKKVVASGVFEKFTKTAANARIVGMQAWKVFEASPDGRKGQIGVVAVYSEKLHRMADALFSGNSSGLPEGVPKKRIVEQIPRDGKVLLTTFGVQQKTDENGKLVLVAFGQSVPKSDNPRSFDAAYDKAKLEAMSSLRSFAGEIALVESDLAKFESVEEFENGMEDYRNEEYFRKKVKTKADALKVSGIKKIYRWEDVHPLTNKKVAGVVISWSPDSAAKASELSNKMATVPQKTGSKGPSFGIGSTRQPTGNNQGGSYHGAGATADKDSF